MRRSLPLDFEPRAVCARCGRPKRVCWCAHLTAIDTKTRVVLLQHPREEDMAIGTARMASMCLPNSELHVGVDFTDSPALTRALSDRGRTIRVPVHVYEEMSKLSAAVDYLRQELGEDPTADNISEEVGMTPEKVAGLMHVVQQPISLETTLGNDDEHTLGDFTEATGATSPVESAVESTMRQDVSTLLGRLPERERAVLELRYGILDGRSRTLMEVSREFGLTRERIRQIEAQALNRIRGLQEIESLREYLG